MDAQWQKVCVTREIHGNEFEIQLIISSAIRNRYIYCITVDPVEVLHFSCRVI
jgi:hypothetical protein